MSYVCQDPEINVVKDQNGDYKVELIRDGRSVSGCWIVVQSIAVGCSQVDMGGIAGVGTEDDCRYQGLSRRVLQEAMRFMEQAELGLTMLYGIPNYYHKFGYASAGPNRLVYVEPSSAVGELPSGWNMRSLQADDLPDIQRIYSHYLSLNVCGARIRPEGMGSWSRLRGVASGERDDECIVLTAPDGHVAAYACHGRGSWSHNALEQAEPATFVISEPLAESPAAADALLQACQKWMPEVAGKMNRNIKRIAYAVTEEGAVAAALMRTNCEFNQIHRACANCMVRVANMQQLFENMMPEWRRLARNGALHTDDSITFDTELGSKSLHVGLGGVHMCAPSESGNRLKLSIGQLGQLVLGSLPVFDFLAQLPEPASAEVKELCQLLFPKRQQHMYLTDRY
ncbi:MAG: GNAT family N-acetyltransferase [Armatimonadota bacterium]